MIPAPEIAWLALLPALIVAIAGVVAMIADLWMEGPDREALGWIGIVGLAVTAIASAALWNTNVSTLAGAITLDRYALFFALLFCVASALTLLLSMGYLQFTDVRSGDYYTLVLFATVGMILMAAATDLIVLFLALEVMSVAAYALAGIARAEPRSNEAALKYFLLGAFATGFLLFGIALVYGATGSTTLATIVQRLPEAGSDGRFLLTAGAGLLIVGFGFKIGAVPFHMWTPDVYEGAPTSVTAFMAVGVKAAAFAAFARVLMDTFGSVALQWADILWVLAVLTMTVGNVTALMQSNIKRMLAYSSIAHAGYALVGVVAGGEAGGSALLLYLAVYAFMTMGAFTVVAALARAGAAKDDLDDYAGVGLRNPFLGMAMVVFMLSLAGVPPFAGFAGKFYVFSAAVGSGYVGLTVIGVLNSLVSVYYYVGVLVRMYMTEGEADEIRLGQRPYLLATLLLTVVATIAFGILPSSLFELSRQAFAALG
jgi:NADH-quinone oxidoreductase subunit N